VSAAALPSRLVKSRSGTASMAGIVSRAAAARQMAAGIEVKSRCPAPPAVGQPERGKSRN
jgi:hypothetical protein